MKLAVPKLKCLAGLLAYGRLVNPALVRVVTDDRIENPSLPLHSNEEE